MPSIIHGDCLAVMPTLPAESFDAIVCDPPYGLGFMGKAWDDLPPGLPWAQQCLRVLKPGGHILAFGGTRTSHRLAVAIEDAGFEIRDSIAWLYGSGFPKSLDVSKAIDKAAGVQREVLGLKRHARDGDVSGQAWASKPNFDGVYAKGGGTMGPGMETAPATDAAKQWDGFGTALKPAHEPIVVARKPFPGTVAANVLAHGTGALNIDATRIGYESAADMDQARVPQPVFGVKAEGAGSLNFKSGEGRNGVVFDPSKGRWPANVCLDESQASALDEQSGTLTSGALKPYTAAVGVDRVLTHGLDQKARAKEYVSTANTGGASRFFYVAKAGKRERPVVDGVAHPTVKPLALMRWLCRLVTPPGGLILDPFAGSGATLEAALLEGFRVTGIEREADYIPLIRLRLERAA